MASERTALRTAAAFIVLTMAAALQAYSQQPRPPRPLIIISEPKATVWIDGVRYGTTGVDGRLSVRSIAAGPHRIRVRADGFHEVTKPITAAQNGEIAITLTKTNDPGELAFQEAERLTTVDRAKAAAAYKRAVKLDPKNFDAYIGLARVSADAGEFENAVKAIREAKRLRPTSPEAAAVEGRILKETGEEEKAITAFKRGIAYGKGFQPEAYAGLGLLYKDRAEAAGSEGDFDQEKANYDEASKYLATAVKQLSGAPDAVVLYQLLGLLYERQKRYKEAIGIYENFLEEFPDTPEASAVRSFITQIKKQMGQ